MKRGTRKKKLRGGSNLRLGILAMFKNEEMVLKEWIDHYLWQGADVIVLLNNNSSDNFRQITDQYKDKVFVLDAPEKHQQAKNYHFIGLPELKKHRVDIVAILDVDEYMFGSDGQNMKEHVVKIFGKPDRPSQIKCKWTLFGSNGHTKQPRSIRKSFTRRNRDQSNPTKTIFWLNDIIMAGVHESSVSGNTIECPAGLQLNHYKIMSKEYFEKFKMTRGDPQHYNAETLRNWNYFEKIDKNANNLLNTKLADLTGGSNIRLGILAQFKNEEMVLKEWIDHYLWQGADVIVLLNNNSSDNFRQITDQYKDKVFVLDAPKNHAQPDNYNLIGLPELKKHKVDVMAILDIDEYMFGTDGKNMKQHIVEIFG